MHLLDNSNTLHHTYPFEKIKLFRSTDINTGYWQIHIILKIKKINYNIKQLFNYFKVVNNEILPSFVIQVYVCGYIHQPNPPVH